MIQISSDLDEHHRILISESALLNNSFCMIIDNQTEYVLSIPVGEFNLENREPLGKQSISIADYDGENLISYDCFSIAVYRL